MRNRRQFPEAATDLISTPFGSVRMYLDGRDLCITNLEVDPARRGHGHGTELLEMVLREADIRGSNVVLGARAELHPWYERHGFAVQPGRDFLGYPMLVRAARR